MGSKKVWEQHEQVLEMLDDDAEPTTRQPTPRSGTTGSYAGPTIFEEKRYKLARSTNMLLRVLAGIVIFYIVVSIVAAFISEDALGGKAGGGKGGEHGVIPPSSNPSNFDSLVGLEGVKNAMQQVLRPLPIPNLKPVRGLLMYGPPGCGKTEIAKAAAGQFGMTFISVSCSNIMHPLFGQSAINLRSIFALARSHQPCIVLFDEVDTLVSGKDNNSGGYASEESNKVVSQWLIEMSKVTNEVNTQVFIFAATNHPTKLDTATLRRFEKKVYVPLPNATVRSAILRRSYPHLDPDQIRLLADLTFGYSSADLETIEKQVYSLMMERYKNVTDFKGRHIYPPMDIIERAVRSTPASSSDREIRAFKSWSKKYGGDVEPEDPPANSRRPAGGVALTAEQQDIAEKLIVADDRFPKMDDIAGLEGVKSVLRSHIYSLLRGGNGVSVLLYGPAGTGKSTIAKAVARYATEMSGDPKNPWRVLPISSQDIISKYAGESEKLVEAVFRVAESNQPCVVFMDEIDSLFQASEGKGDGSAMAARVKNAFQTIMSDLIDNPSKIMVIGTTNNPEVFDGPMRRRFNSRLYVPLPGKQARKLIFKNLLNTDQYQFSEAALDGLAAATASWSGADITSVVGAARTKMMMLLEMEGNTQWNPRHIRQDVLAHLIRNHVPTNSLDTIKTLHGWAFGEKLDIEEDDIMSSIYNPLERLYYGV